jgi:hypothetical protein
MPSNTHLQRFLLRCPPESIFAGFFSLCCIQAATYRSRESDKPFDWRFLLNE